MIYCCCMYATVCMHSRYFFERIALQIILHCFTNPDATFVRLCSSTGPMQEFKKKYNNSTAYEQDVACYTQGMTFVCLIGCDLLVWLDFFQTIVTPACAQENRQHNNYGVYGVHDSVAENQTPRAKETCVAIEGGDRRLHAWPRCVCQRKAMRCRIRNVILRYGGINHFDGRTNFFPSRKMVVIPAMRESKALATLGILVTVIRSTRESKMKRHGLRV